MAIKYLIAKEKAFLKKEQKIHPLQLITMQFPYFSWCKGIKIYLERGKDFLYENTGRFSHLFHHFGVPKLPLKGKAKFGLLTNNARIRRKTLE